MKQYFVLTMKDKWFSGKFDPQKQDALNAYAQQGWRLISAQPQIFRALESRGRNSLR